MTIDPKGLSHILAHDEVYQKPAGSRFNLAQTIGPGLPVTEGAHHRLQVRQSLMFSAVCLIHGYVSSAQDHGSCAHINEL